MRDCWSKHWCPDQVDPNSVCNAWKRFASDARMPTQHGSAEAVPSWNQFQAAAASCKGAAGFDGWTAKELKALSRHFPQLLRELYNLWVETTMSFRIQSPTDTPPDSLWTWKILGIPKKTSFDSRPIAIGSLLVRTSHKALLKVLPPVPYGQFCGRAKTSVTTATASYLCSKPQHVAETDLSKAFDSLLPELVETAFTHQGAPKHVAHMLTRAWRGPRICTVDGDLAELILPLRGIPQGDPVSPLALAVSLAPWNKLTEALDCNLRTWAYMDDRSIAVIRQGSRGLLNRALEFTRQFDSALGFAENNDKTQIWSHSDPPPLQGFPLEHLGLRHNPGRPDQLTQVRDPDKAPDAISRLGRCPGGIPMRCRLATAFINPLFDWASPLLPPGSADDVTRLFQALTNAKATWWCKNRLWCQHIDLHPKFAVAIRGLCNAANVINFPSPHLDALLKQHASILKLRIISFGPHSIRVRSSSPNFPASPCHDEQFANATLVQGDRVAHFLRQRARRMLLLQVPRGRNDCEGIDNVDLEACSSAKFRRYCNSLDSRQYSALVIFRSGAISTPTRRNRPDEHSNATSCPYCGGARASARHWFVECSRFDNTRAQLEATHSIPHDWWHAQPRCTTKSAWITMRSARTLAQRVDRLIACSKLGIAITLAHDPDA